MKSAPLKKRFPSAPAWSLFLVLACTAACGGDDGRGPVDPPVAIGDTLPIAPGDSVTRTLATPSLQYDSVVVYRFTPAVPTEVALYLKTTGGAANLRVTFGETLWDFRWYPNAQPLLTYRTDRFVVPAGSPLDIRVSRDAHETGAVTARLFLYEVKRAPEHVPATYVLGDTLAGEELELSADIDEYTIAGTAGADWAAFLEAPGPMTDDGSGWSALDIVRPAGDVVTGLRTWASGTTLEDNGSSGTLTETATHIVRVFGDNWPSPEAQPYRFQVRPVNRAPEVARVINAPGDSIVEAIGSIGDIDEFTVQGAAGQLFNLRYVMDPPLGSGALLFSFFGPDAPFFGGVLSYEGTTGRSGRIALPGNGKLQVRVVGYRNSTSSRGGYRVYLVTLSAAPEHAAATLAAGDSVVSEDLGSEGDLDEFVLSVPTTTLMNFVLSHTPAAGARFITLSRLDATGETALQSVGVGGTDTWHGSGRTSVPAGTYRLRVDAGAQWGLQETAPLPYRFHAYRIGLAPETAPASLVFGTAVTDRIDPIGDMDTFTLAGSAGDVIRLTFSVPGDPSALAMGTYIIIPSHESHIPDNHVGGQPGPPVELPETGTYTVAVDAEAAYGDGVRGAYTLRVDHVPVTPETAPSTINANGSVTESLAAYDIDEYLVTGTPGGELSVVLSHTLPNRIVCAEVLAAASPARLGSAGSIGYPLGTGPLRLDASGKARVRLWAPGQFNACPLELTSRIAGQTEVPSYRVDVYNVNRAPESVPATFTIGSTIQGEAINFPGDMDEYQFAGTAGQRISVSMREVTPGDGPTGQTRVEVLAPGGTVVLALNNGFSAPFTLPVTGTYLLRMRTADNVQGNSGYEFSVIAAP